MGNNNRSLNKSSFGILLAILICVFAFGVVRLFNIRFETGDVYPAYSSLRADPLGTKALYDSLSNLRGVSVRRNYEPEARLRGGQQAAVFYFGLRAEELERANTEDIEALEVLASEGSRVVITLYPEDFKKAGYRKETEEKKKKDDSSEKRLKPGPAQEGCGNKACIVSLPKRWGFTPAYFEDRQEHPFAKEAVSAAYDFALPKRVSWHSAVYFESLDDKWNKVYTVNDQPVLIARDFGKGKIALSSDSFFVSNEALSRERQSGLLLWLVGDNRRVIFDETHFGIRENPGLASLIRKYRLHGLLAGVALLGLLFVWKNSVSLVPFRREDAPGMADARAGRDSFSGFVGLLRRNIPPGNILAACLEEWIKAFPRGPATRSEELKQVRSIVDARQGTSKDQDLIKAYQQIAKILSERKAHEQ